MDSYIFCTAGGSKATAYTAELLKDTYHFLPCPDKRATHVLLGVPSLNMDGSLIGGGALEELLEALSRDVTIVGGNLRHPKLTGYKKIDLLQDPMYLAKNANITAHCALRYALEELPVTLEGCPVLILGWGRIAKCLAKLLANLGAQVSIAARKETDRAMASALGFQSLKITAVEQTDYKLIYNTIPQMVLPRSSCDAVKVDLASTPGMEGDDILYAKGLPGKFAPVSSGELIAQTVIRLVGQKEDCL